jgi:hypothetical protein
LKRKFLHGVGFVCVGMVRASGREKLAGNVFWDAGRERAMDVLDV